MNKLDWSALAAILVMSSAGCGGAVGSGVALGKVGRGLSAHASTSPRGVDLCLLQEALAQQSGGAEKPMSDACSKALKSDRLWRRAIVVLSAYGDTLATVAAGDATNTTGQVEAASTGVSGSDWMEVDSADTAARDAVAQLVAHFRDTAKNDDLAALIKGAAPHVKTLCTGLGPYLDGQARGFGDAQKEIEKKRVAKIERRCGSIDNKSVCVSDSATDRVVYAVSFGNLAMLESNHIEARDSLAGFCAAHLKLEAAAQAGTLSKDGTVGEVVDAIRGARGAEAAPAKEPAATPKK
jgi:hypothetical protein